MLLAGLCFLSKGREVYKDFIFNLTRALGAKNDSHSDIMNIIDFEIKLAQVCSFCIARIMLFLHWFRCLDTEHLQ